MQACFGPLNKLEIFTNERSSKIFTFLNSIILKLSELLARLTCPSKYNNGENSRGKRSKNVLLTNDLIAEVTLIPQILGG